jgi:MoxR-like ATPase
MTGTPGPVDAVRDSVAKVVVGKRDTVDLLLVALLCRGHVLIEDVPGVGKTLMARALAASLGCAFGRIQFTPDVLPSDVTGSSVFDQKTSEFVFRSGPVFTQVLLADEINRATPRAQSALLEAMEERQVTVDGHTNALPNPFFVLATQNPVDLEGTFPLPEAQLDRFLLRVSPGYPTLEEEDAILTRFERDDPLQSLGPVCTPDEIRTLQERRQSVFVSDEVRAYLLEVVRATRADERLTLGASPRAALALHRAVQARTLIEGREFALPDDVKVLASSVLSHRLILRPEARLRGHTPSAVIQQIVDATAVPVEEEASAVAGPGSPL